MIPIIPKTYWVMDFSQVDYDERDLIIEEGFDSVLPCMIGRSLNLFLSEYYEYLSGIRHLCLLCPLV